MRNRPSRFPRRWLAAAGAAGPLLALTLTACGSSSHAGTASTTAPPPSSSGSPAPSAPVGSATTAAVPTTSAPTTAAATAGLSGRWTGHYTGTFTGTFDLTWQQSGDSLAGTIAISSLNDGRTPINGTVQGSSIRFGTVGSEAITYTGSVSGGSMSGSWQIAAGGQNHGGGSWTASRS